MEFRNLAAAAVVINTIAQTLPINTTGNRRGSLIPNTKRRRVYKRAKSEAYYIKGDREIIQGETSYDGKGDFLIA